MPTLNAILLVAPPTLLTALVAAAAPARLYRQLEKPRWAVPGWAFGPVWLVLYLLMGTAAVLHLRAVGISEDFLLYGFQLSLNAAWSWIFFGARMPRLALFEMGALWLLVAATLFAFAASDPVAGILLIPYLVWLSLAFALNLSILRLNPPGSPGWSDDPATPSADPCLSDSTT